MYISRNVSMDNLGRLNFLDKRSRNTIIDLIIEKYYFTAPAHCRDGYYMRIIKGHPLWLSFNSFGFDLGITLTRTSAIFHKKNLLHLSNNSPLQETIIQLEIILELF